jgi:hypothetical protein
MTDVQGGDFGQARQEVGDGFAGVGQIGREQADQIEDAGPRAGRRRGGRRRRGVTGGEPGEPVADFLDAAGIGFRPALVMLELGPQDVAGGQKGVHHLRAQGQFFLAQAVQQAFQHMGDAGHVGEAEGAAAALDGMGGPKDGVEVFQGRGVHVQVEQQVFHVRQVFRGFLEKHLEELAHVDAHDVRASGFSIQGSGLGPGRRDSPP